MKEAQVNPLTPSGQNCSDWAKNFSVASLINFKNIMFYALIFSRTVKKLGTILYFFLFENL
jgi:hypothetical protein